MSGHFITLEGGEGAGKSTQLRLLAGALAARQADMVPTREPGGTPGAELLRGLLLSGETAWAPAAEALLHFAARAEHVAKLIRPALARGALVLCDRFFDSTMAYQGYGQNADRAMIAALTALLGIVPDLTIILDVSPQTSLARLAARGGAPDRYESLGQGFLARVNAGFRAIAAADPARCVLVSAEGDAADIHAAILDILAERGLLPA